MSQRVELFSLCDIVWLGEHPLRMVHMDAYGMMYTSIRVYPIMPGPSQSMEVNINTHPSALEGPGGL